MQVAAEAPAIVQSLVEFIQKNRLVLLAAFVLVMILWGIRLFRGEPDQIRKSGGLKRFVKRVRFIARKVYVKFMHATEYIPVVGDLIGNIRHGYKVSEALTDDDATIRTGRVLVITIAVFIVAMFFGMWWFKDIVCAMITSFEVAHIAMTSLKSNARKFLINLNEATEDFLLAYHKSSGNIDAAFFAVKQSGNPASRHLSIMHTYIQRAYVSDDPETVQAEYNVIAPSRFLRNLYAVIFMTYKYGEQLNNGRNAMDANIMDIQEQIGDAIYQQNKLKDDTAGERWFIILPVFAIPLLSKYMQEFFAFEGFEYITTFLTSSTGYIVRVICTILSLICYLLYAQMVDRRVLEARTRNSWEKKVLRNTQIRKIVLKLLPLDSPSRAKMQTTIVRAGSNDTVNALQIRRIFLAFFMAIISLISVGINILNNQSTIYKDIYTGMPKENYTYILMTQEDMDTYIEDMLVADKAAIKYINAHKREYRSLAEIDRIGYIKDYLRDSGNLRAYRGYYTYGIQRIMSKVEHLDNTTGLGNLLFVAIMALIGYIMPYSLLVLQAFMNKDMIIIDEVSDLQKTTIMLMEYESTTPESLLSWYASSSILLAPQLRECKVTKDFDALSASVDYKPFVQLATSLRMAFEGLTLKEAFSGVEQRLITGKKEQNRVVERMLGIRTRTVGIFTGISMGSVIALYMFMPLLISMVQMFMSLNIFG